MADLLEEMEPDEAADLLAELPEERSRGLLALMNKEEFEDVRKLLSYPEDSAGGIMTTEYACRSAGCDSRRGDPAAARELPDDARNHFLCICD